jgi:hypothetical protein
VKEIPMNAQMSELLSPPGADLKDFHEVEPINESDSACLDEVCEVLKKHGKLERFGVSLLHKHFDLAADEVLVEDNDPQTRVLTVKAVKKNQTDHLTETMWRFVDGQRVATLRCDPSWCHFFPR